MAVMAPPSCASCRKPMTRVTIRSNGTSSSWYVCAACGQRSKHG